MSVYAWHFTAGNKLRDGSPLPAVGATLKFDKELILCKQGLHASMHPFDALKYAPGDTLHLVHCAGTILHQDDKLVCTERTIIASFEASEMLRYFARMLALSVLHLAPENMESVVEDWLMTGDNRSAAKSAAYSAARSAADYAACFAAYAAADSAADYAACSAAKSAAYSAADYASASADRQSFAALVYECFEGPMENVGFAGHP